MKDQEILDEAALSKHWDNLDFDSLYPYKTTEKTWKAALEYARTPKECDCGFGRQGHVGEHLSGCLARKEPSATDVEAASLLPNYYCEKCGKAEVHHHLDDLREIVKLRKQLAGCAHKDQQASSLADQLAICLDHLSDFPNDEGDFQFDSDIRTATRVLREFEAARGGK